MNKSNISTTKKKLLDMLENNNNNNNLTKEDIDLWATKLTEEDNFPHYLENKNLEIIQQEIKNICFRENISQIQDISNKLKEYRYVDKICDLFRGRFVRWIRLPAGSMTKGGIVADIKFLENGTYILVKNSLNRFIQYKYDECITFQKLSVDELFFLSIS